MKFSSITITFFTAIIASATPIPEAHAMADPGILKMLLKKKLMFGLYGYGNSGQNGGQGNGINNGNNSSGSNANSGGSSSSANSGGNRSVTSNSSGNTVNINVPKKGTVVTDQHGNVIYTYPSGDSGNNGSNNNSNNSGNNNNNGNDNDNKNNNNNNNNNDNDNKNNNNNENNNTINNIIYIVPNGLLSTGTATADPSQKVPGAVPFQGTVVNGVLYANAPNLSNGLGAVTVNSNGQLQVVNNPTVTGNGWVVQNGTVSPYGQTIYSCPSADGVSFLYAGSQCPGSTVGEKISLKTSNPTTIV